MTPKSGILPPLKGGIKLAHNRSYYMTISGFPILLKKHPPEQGRCLGCKNNFTMNNYSDFSLSSLASFLDFILR